MHWCAFAAVKDRSFSNSTPIAGVSTADPITTTTSVTALRRNTCYGRRATQSCFTKPGCSPMDLSLRPRSRQWTRASQPRWTPRLVLRRLCPFPIQRKPFSMSTSSNRLRSPDVQRNLSFVQAINEALHAAMAADPSVICYGLGVDDPKTIFGTTKGLKEHFGPERVWDMPTSENAMTGVAIGAALQGLRPVMVHQRLDFFLLALDQLVNNSAKWHYMFGGQRSVPITIRLILGRGWGQGPTHSQSLHAWFAHVPGLKVVMPTSAEDAYGLLLSSIFDDNPVLFLAPRWLHETVGPVPEGDYRLPIGKARVLREGSDLTIVAMSYMVVEAIHAIE